MEAEKENMKCGLIIVNFNEYPVTEELLARIKDAPEIDHIVIVDNASTDDSFAQLSKYQNDRITLLQSGRDGGYSFGNNVGARYLIEHYNPDIIGIANPDTAFDGAHVGRIKQLFEEYPDYAVLAGIMSNHEPGHPALCFSDDESTPGKFIGFLCNELFVRPFANLAKLVLRRENVSFEKNYKRFQEILHSPHEVNQVWSVAGCLFFIRREDFEAAGMFDENVFLMYEEQILAYKLNCRLSRKEGLVNTLEYVHDHRTPKHASKLDLLNSGLNALRIRDASSSYYFRTYVTDSKFLHVVYAFLLKLRWLKTYTAYYFKRLIYRV